MAELTTVYLSEAPALFAEAFTVVRDAGRPR
jgi:hypothetical protein